MTKKFLRFLFLLGDFSFQLFVTLYLTVWQLAAEGGFLDCSVLQGMGRVERITDVSLFVTAPRLYYCLPAF